MVLRRHRPDHNRKVSIVVASPTPQRLLGQLRALPPTPEATFRFSIWASREPLPGHLAHPPGYPSQSTLLVETMRSQRGGCTGHRNLRRLRWSAPNSYEGLLRHRQRETISASKAGTPASSAVTAYSRARQHLRGGGTKTKAVAAVPGPSLWPAVLLLVIVAGGVLTSLGAFGSPGSCAPKASASETASAGAILGHPDRQDLERPRSRIRGAFRSPQNPRSGDMDSLIPNLTDDNASTAWISYGFGTANYAGTIREFGLALKPQTPTVVSS